MKSYFIPCITLILILTGPSYSKENDYNFYNTVSTQLIDSYTRNDYKNFSKSFNSPLLKFLTKEKFNDIIKSLKHQMGEVNKIGELNVINSNTVIYPVYFEKGILNMILTFDDKNKLSGLSFQEPEKIVVYPKITKDISIDNIVDPYIKNNMGLGIGTIDSNGDVKEYYYGKEGINNNIPNSNTLFEIGSITKVFTTITLADLHLKKKVSLKDNLDKYVKASNYKGNKIILENLATHTSGIPRLPENLLNDTSIDILNPYSKYTSEKMYKALENYNIQIKPGTKYEYSNFAMGVLGDILALSEKTDYESLINRTILKPLSMNNTSVNLSKTNIMKMAKPYNNKLEQVSFWDFQSMQGAGALKSNIPDMLKFLKANIDLNTSLKDAMSLSHKTFYQDKNFDMGLGWHKSKFNNDTLIWHNGGTGGFTSFIGFLEKKKVGVVVFSNTTNSVDELSTLILKKLSIQ